MRLASISAALVPLLLTTPAVAQTTLATGSAPDIPWFRLIFSFALCIGLAAGAIVLLRRYQGVASKGLLGKLGSVDRFAQAQVRIVETRRISTSAHICLVEFDERQFLLAVNATAITIVAERNCPADAAASTEM